MCAYWQLKMLSTVGRLALVQSPLSNILIFIMSFYHIPLGVRTPYLVIMEDEDGL